MPSDGSGYQVESDYEPATLINADVKKSHDIDDEATTAPADKAASTGLTKSALLNNSLAVPFSLPIRPLSPDTISSLSVEEYAQLQPIRRLEY